MVWWRYASATAFNTSNASIKNLDFIPQECMFDQMWTVMNCSLGFHAVT